MSEFAPILIADDQRDVLQALRLMLKSEGFQTVCVGDPADAIAAVSERNFGAALLDLNYTRDTTSGQEGLELIGRLRQLDPDLPIVVMTAWGTIDLAVQAVQAGAGDFIEKPWDNARLLTVLRNQLALGQARRATQRLQAENDMLRADERADSGEFIAASAAMRPVMQMVERVAPADANILITGENGTGKSELADLIHARSSRAGKAFIKVNMGGISEHLFESEMFGHVRGAFTDAKGDRIGRFELADGGTLFLDEIGNIPLSQQAKLLRVLEDGEFERVGSSRTQSAQVRVISATNADLDSLIGEQRFRQDLLFRLNTVEIRLPPLRERGEDIARLATRFLARHAQRYRRENLSLSEEAVVALQRYRWPGNVRELNHVLERAVLMAGSEQISVADLHLRNAGGAGSPVSTDDRVRDAMDGLTLEAAEEMMIRQALTRSAGNLSHAADALGLSRAALYRRLEKYGIEAGG
ncbi:MAG: sigma-54-dependent Fis family transcriptional regulator [Xanthomonadales bacterium]|nr:sigma-54-dependent Fis family transcriptional regulator [Xanthomonadales bacterium]